MTDNADLITRAWLHAADTGSIEELRSILTTHPQLLNFRDRHQHLKASTALHLCAWRNHAEAAEFLLQMGADVEARDEAGMTPLQIDILRVCMERMRPMPLLRSRCIDVSSPVALARYKRRLVRDRSAYDQIDTSTMEVLLRHNADVNQYSEVGETALLLAVDDGLIKHVKLLLAHGANAYYKDKHGRMVLDIAAEHGYADLVELFMTRHPDLIDLAGERALLRAVCHDSAPTLRLLYPAAMNMIQTEQDRVALGGHMFHTAIEYDAPECAAYFLEHGVPVDWLNEEGETALHIACKYCRPSLLEMLLQHRADGNRCSLSTGYSPYHLAVQRHGLTEIQILALFGADINVVDRNMDTPLSYAAKNGHSMELMEALIHHGGHFLFLSLKSRDSIAPILAQWLYRLAPMQLPALVDRLLLVGCVDQDRSRGVILSLIWSQFIEEAILFVLLALFSSQRQHCHQAQRVLLEWLKEHHGHVVVRKLVYDSLNRST